MKTWARQTSGLRHQKIQFCMFFPCLLHQSAAFFCSVTVLLCCFFEYALPVAAASSLFVLKLLLYPPCPPFTLKTLETLFLYWWQGVSVLKHLRVCFIILGSVTLSAPTVHEVLGGNPNACCRFIINTHLRQPYQARRENDNSFLCFSFWGQRIALCAFTKGNNIFFSILMSKDKVKKSFYLATALSLSLTSVQEQKLVRWSVCSGKLLSCFLQVNSFHQLFSSIT